MSNLWLSKYYSNIWLSVSPVSADNIYIYIEEKVILEQKKNTFSKFLFKDI